MEARYVRTAPGCKNFSIELATNTSAHTMMTRLPTAPRRICVSCVDIRLSTSKGLRRHDVAVPRLDGRGHQGWIITHGKMMSIRHHHLASVREQQLPPRLEAERIVALAKD